MKKMHGVNTPLVTHFDQHGQVDFEAMKDHIDFLISKGIDNLYPMGTIGEGNLMSVSERQKLAEQIVEHVNGRVGVFIHVGAISLHEALELARHAQQIGADGIGAVSPFFYHLTQEDIYSYFAEISRSVSDDFPVYLYNLPDLTGNDIQAETVLKLSQRPNIVGIKNTMPTTFRLFKLLSICPPDFDVISGDDMVAFAGLALGAVGLVSGTSNIFPEVFTSMYKNVQKNNLAEAAAEQHKVYRIAEMLDFNFKPSAIKAMLEMRGFRKTYARAPLQCICTDKEFADYRKCLKEIFKDTDYIV